MKIKAAVMRRRYIFYGTEQKTSSKLRSRRPNRQLKLEKDSTEWPIRLLHWSSRGIMIAKGADVRDLIKMSAQLQPECRRDHNVYYRKICGEIELHSGRCESRDLYHKIRYLTRPLTSKTWASKDYKGEIVTEIDQISATCSNYCQSLFYDSL